VRRVLTITDNDYSLITSHPEINSLRFYDTIPDFGNLTAGVFAVAYSQKTPVLDIMDFTPKVKRWLNTTSQSVGNWVSKEGTEQSMNALEIAEVLVYKDGIPLEVINDFLQKNNRIGVLGFDVLQIPRYKVIFELKIE